MSDLTDLASADNYFIRCDGKPFVGRNYKEDSTLNPKKINCPTDHDYNQYPDRASTLPSNTLDLI